MLKSIRIQQEVYDSLEAIRGKRETFGECISKLIVTYRKLLEIQYGGKTESKP